MNSIFFAIEASPRQNESTLSFALGSHSIYHNGTFSISQMRKSKLACDLPWREKVREANYRTRYLFNGKELDTETNLYYYGARYFEPNIEVWYGCDPLAEKYPFNSAYVYCSGNPVKYVDPDGRAGVLIVYPDYNVDTESFLGKQRLGHAGVLLIDETTGYTRYYEYGRYHTGDGTKGKVRNIPVPNVVIDPATGKPTAESMDKVLKRLSQKSGQNGKVEGAYVEGDFKLMNDYAQSKMNESDPNSQDYNKEREPYSLMTNNCATFGCDVLNQDPSVKENAPLVLFPSPNNTIEEYQKEYPVVEYIPENK